MLVASDLAVLSIVVFGTQVLWFGLDWEPVSVRESSALSAFPYWIFSGTLIALWMWALALIDSRSDRVIGSGWTEYTRIASASLRLFGVIAIAAFLLRVDLARGYLLISLPVGVTLLVLVRWLWRQWLVRQRIRGRYSARVLLIGSRATVTQILTDLHRAPTAGYHVVGACIPGSSGTPLTADPTLPLFGSLAEVRHAMETVNADTVAITSTDDLPPRTVKRISWELEAGTHHLVLAPNIADIAGPRISTRPVAGLPLIHVETPRYTRGQRFAKRASDIVLSAFALILGAPLLLIIAAVVRFTSAGPVLFSQTRIGQHGQPFRIYKFRTMTDGAESQLADVLPQRSSGNEVLFKMTRDPRVTSVGRFLRRYSLDELPQLVNILRGDMSLVGPRPPLPHEVERYAAHVHRRFLVKPGLTGLWQVSGRSTLSWDETVRLDLSYVENWTLFSDALILARTVRAVLRPGNTAA